MNSKKNKHLTLDDRLTIQEELTGNSKFNVIAKKVGKDPTTISKEIRKHFVVKHSQSRKPNKQQCPLLAKAPYVCNGCPKKNQICRYDKHMYYAKHAHKQYLEELSYAREGIPLTKESFYQTEKIVTDAIKNGQHIYHITQTYNLGVSKSTLYRYIEKGLFHDICKLDLPRAVNFKLRKPSKAPSIPAKQKEGRHFSDFQQYLLDNQIDSWIELDTVIGRVGGKVLVTFNYSRFNFLFGLLIEDKTAQSVSIAVQNLKQSIEEHGILFSEKFPVILTDNGGEFAHIEQIMKDYYEPTQSELFFCDPNSPFQKGKIEKNHSIFRDIVPKGTSFDSFTQQDINVILSHVNSVRRQHYQGKSAYEQFVFYFDKKLAQLLGIEEIEAEKVIQSPLLLKQFGK